MNENMRHSVYSTPTKGKIFDTAVRMFYENGYNQVSMREIAKQVGIKAASIYNHFESKESILKAMYDFYDFNWHRAELDINDLLPLCETESPRDVLAKTDFRFPPDIDHKPMDCILTIAVREIHTHELSAQLVRNRLLNMGVMRPLLEHMIETGKIEYLDINVFERVWTNYVLSAALLNSTPFQLTLQEWKDGMGLLLTLVKPK
jgi:AcrR family transcriptional regulator